MTKTKPSAKKITLLSLAIPILVEQILRSLMGTVNTFMLSRLSDDASAAVGVANQILNLILMGCSMCTAGAAVLLNQSLGAEKKRESAQIMMNAITISCIAGLIFSSITVIFSHQMLQLMNLDASLIEDGTTYLQIVGASCLLQFVSTMFTTIFRSRGKALTAALVIIFNNAVNLGGSILVINGLLPIQGVFGIATVRFISEGLGLLLIIFLFSKQKWEQKFKDLFRLNKFYVQQIVRIGFMSGMTGVCYMSAQLITTSFITSLPNAVLSAKVYTQTINSYTYVVGQSVGYGAQILTGYMLGAGENEKAYQYVKKTWLKVLACNIVFSILFWAGSDLLVGLFTASDEIKAIAKTLFFIDIITCCGRSLNHSFCFGLNASGYIFWSMMTSIVSITSVQVFLAYGLTISAGLGIIGIWIAQAADEWIRGLATMGLWLSKRWTKTAVLKQKSKGPAALNE